MSSQQAFRITPPNQRRQALAESATRFLSFLCLWGFSSSLLAHGVDESTKQFLLANEGVAVIPYMYIGAKHMMTGYDHLLFLVGVIFFLYRPKDVVVYVTFFTIGHSITLLGGVLNNIAVNAYLIDAIIGFSIIYKAFDNLGGFKRLFDYQPSTKLAVLIFGLFHGFGLATKIQEFEIPQDGLVENLVSFNVGVEFGQFLALIIAFIALAFWRRHRSFMQFSTVANMLLMSAGMVLMGYQLTGFFVNT
jgi:cbb3-type cytochrome oxidase subunit 3